MRTLAGSDIFGYDDGTGTTARFDSPSGVAVDNDGNVYVADTRNNRIRKITPEGVVSTLAGSTKGYQDGAGAVAQFYEPAGVAVDSAGNVYVADNWNHRIRKISPEGVVSTLAGSGPTGAGQGGFADGDGTKAQFNKPTGVAVGSDGNVYVTEDGSARIRKINPEGVVSTLAGSDSYGYQDGTGTAARFSFLSSVTVDSSGNVYVTEFYSSRIRRISSEGVVSTIAGSRRDIGEQGYQDGPGNMARFNNPTGVAVDSDGNLYVADYGNHRIRKIVFVP